MRLHDIYQQAVAEFHAADIPNVDFEVSLLFSHILKLTRTELFLRKDAAISEQDARQLKQMLARRLKREPLAYILGEWEFWSLPFYVTPEVLVPRPETELLVEYVLSFIANTNNDPLILELGTGSGIIPIVLALESRKAGIVSIDCSQAALRVADRNAARHNVEDRIDFLNGFWLDALLELEIFDCVVANPPYVTEGFRSRMQPELEYEPEGALFSGEKGMDAMHYFIPQTARVLKPGGRLFIETGSEQHRLMAELFAECTDFGDVKMFNDYSGLPRVISARKTPV